jgi:hypothetical protein
MIDAGEVTPPVELGMPEVLLELETDQSLSDLLLADRDRERRR